MFTAINHKNWVQESRHRSRGSAYLFAPMVDFNVMSEIGDTPPEIGFSWVKIPIKIRQLHQNFRALALLMLRKSLQKCKFRKSVCSAGVFIDCRCCHFRRTPSSH